MKRMKCCHHFFGAVGFALGVLLVIHWHFSAMPAPAPAPAAHAAGAMMAHPMHVWGKEFANWIILAYGLFGYAIGMIVTWILCCIFCRSCKSGGSCKTDA